MARKPETIDEAIGALREVVRWARENRSRVGYFAALYCGMTLRVRAALVEGRFRQPDRLERLDVAFVNRYLDAVDALRNGGEVTESWRYSFESATKFWPIVTQHLLLGCNAHINLDLGIAVADVTRGEDLSSLRSDFDEINRLLAAHVETVQDQLAGVWPWLGLLDRLSRADEAIVNYAMRVERDLAWSIAERLHAMNDAQLEDEIALLDGKTATLARMIRHPGIMFSSFLKVVRLGELRSVPRIINLLDG